MVEIRRRPFDIDAARLELDAFEAKYGVPSERRDEPFYSPCGCWTETDEWRDWDFLYTAWTIAIGRRRPHNA